MANAPWELTSGLLDKTEEQSEYNPPGFWLHNNELNRIFILYEDLCTVLNLLRNATRTDI